MAGNYVYGERLKLLRELCGFTQEEVAEYVGVTRQSLSWYERDQREPSLTTAVKLAEKFGVSLDYLVGRDGNSPKMDECVKMLERMATAVEYMGKAIDALEGKEDGDHTAESTD